MHYDLIMYLFLGAFSLDVSLLASFKKSKKADQFYFLQKVCFQKTVVCLWKNRKQAGAE